MNKRSATSNYQGLYSCRGKNQRDAHRPGTRTLLELRGCALHLCRAPCPDEMQQVAARWGWDGPGSKIGCCQAQETPASSPPLAFSHSTPSADWSAPSVLCLAFDQQLMSAGGEINCKMLMRQEACSRLMQNKTHSLSQ